MNRAPYILPVQEPWLSLIADGEKTVEGRAGPATKFAHFVGKRVKFVNKKRVVYVEVIAVHHYKDLYSYLNEVEWHNAAPHLSSFKGTVAAYHKYHNDTEIANLGGINAIHVRVCGGW